MPTYVTIEFIRDMIKSSTVKRQGRETVVWKTIHAVGDHLYLHIGKAHDFVNKGYAKYVH